MTHRVMADGSNLCGQTGPACTEDCVVTCPECLDIRATFARGRQAFDEIALLEEMWRRSA